ncbi:phosphoribosyltransferase [Sphingomonas sp. C3-2]|uniref:phosphoribosyltransferase n=1 Tax=Sphingomonas sp. C3-2 TaxID=3062169 RepID=UPI00294B27DB|nr:phosphoribosyltransferase family protein [Sphingomonas sp. C3-2]WOK36497.1 phosphoribosyltransferase family protein [Sphingomonas sp. C3-2]
MTTPILTPILQEEFVSGIHTLAAKVRASGWIPDFIIGIGRGGLVPGVYLSHAMDVRMLSIDYSSKIYGFGEQLLAEVALRSASGEKVLLVDDINDSGNTICVLREAIEAAGGDLSNVRVAVMINNVSSIEQVDYSVQTIDRKVTKDWFVFPWEAVGTQEHIERDAAEEPSRTA